MSEIKKTDLNKDYIKSKLQKILNKVHTVEQKKKIKDFPERFNMACPICGDSHKWSGAHKKRGNFYFKNATFKCFNCGEIMSFTKLCDEFNEHVDIDEKVKLYKYIDENVTFTTNNNDYIMEEMDKLIDVDEFMNYFNTRKNSWLYDIKPVEPGSQVGQYLYLNRLLPKTNMILQGIYRIVRDGITKFETRVMISLNMSVSMNKILGIQIRNLESNKNKRFYKIVEFDEIYNYMNSNDPLDDLESISYNKLSHFYNILNIDFDKEITVFEGFLDSLFYPNSIGLIGANNDNDILNFLMEADSDIKLKFFYDNDSTGIAKASKMIKKGYSVFLWNKLFDKLVENKPGYNQKEKLKNIIDLNDLVKKSRNNKIYKSLKLDTFFSIDEFDLMFLDKIIYNKEEKTWSIKR